MLPAKCASSDSYVPPPMGAVGDTFEDRDTGGPIEVEDSVVYYFDYLYITT